MNILITGSSGFVGTHLCDHFKKDHEVIKFDLPLDVRCASDVLSKATQDIDAIIHLAAQVRIDNAIKDPLTTFNINVKGTQLILEACRLNDIPKLLFASTADVYGVPHDRTVGEYDPLLTTNPYGASKLAAERLCYAYGETYGINVGILRCFNIYGPGQSAGVVPLFVKKAMKGEPLPINGRGLQKRDYVYISDVVRAYDLMLHKDTKDAFNIGTGRGTSVRELAETIVCVTGSLSKIEYSLGDERPSGDLVASIWNARSHLGWEPTVELKEGIKNVMESLK